MGQAQTIYGGNIDSTRMVLQAYLNMTATINQGLITQQLINVNCGKNTTACNNCIKTVKQYNLPHNNDYSSVCPMCFCTLENIKMNNYITIDFDAFEGTQAESTFQNQIRNSLTQQATQTGTRLFDNTDSYNTLDKTSKRMYGELKKNINNDIIQQIKNFQVININDPNTSLINVDIDIVVTFLSKVIQQSNESSKLLNDYDQTISSLTTEVVEDSITQIIGWLVTLFIIAIVTVFFIFGINIIMDVLMLYAST